MAGHRHCLRIVAPATFALLLVACAVGPDFERPTAPEVEGYAREPLPAETAKADIAGGETQHFVQGLDIPGQWWTLFHSEALNALIEQALKNNPTLPVAQAALHQAWENVYAAQGAFFPTAVASYSPSRNKTATGVVFTAASSGPPYFTLHTSQVVVSYAPDVFGGTRRQVESLMATAEFQGFQVEATYLTLTSNVVAAAVQEASLRGQMPRPTKSSRSRPRHSASFGSNSSSGRWPGRMWRRSRRPWRKPKRHCRRCRSNWRCSATC